MSEREAAEFTLRVCESANKESPAGTNVTLRMGSPLRILPGRREVHEGRWLENGTHIVSKRYLPHRKMERDWKREWRGLIKLQELGIPAPQPLFSAKDARFGTLWVVMRYIKSTKQIKTMLPKLGAQRVAVMGQLADVVTKMHEAGARQTDQHIGNWVYDGSKVYLLDAGTVRFAAGPLSRAERVNDLATLSATLDLPSQDAFRSAQGNAPYAGELPALTVKQQARRLKKHYKKTRRNCTEYKRQDGPAHRGVSANQADQSLVEAFFNSPESFVKQGTRLKSGNTCTVQSFEYQGKAYVLKRYNLKPLPTRLRYSLKESRAMKSWSNAWCLLTAHIPTARPVAVYEERRGILRGRCYLLMEKVEGVLLADYIEKIADAKVLSETAGAVAQVWRGLANIRAVHKDMKATNWIINKRGRAVIFDLDSMVLAQSKHYFEHGRRKDFQRFMKNVSNSPEVEKEFRKQLLEAGQ